MKNLLKELILSEINKAGKSIGSIRSYSIVSSASGIFAIHIWWRGKTGKGAKAKIIIELDGKTANAKLAIDLMIEAMEEAKNISLEQKLKDKNVFIDRGVHGGFDV